MAGYHRSDGFDGAPWGPAPNPYEYASDHTRLDMPVFRPHTGRHMAVRPSFSLRRVWAALMAWLR